MGPEARELVGGPALTVAQQARGNAEELLDLLRARRVVAVLDVDPQRSRQLLGAGLDRGREVDQGDAITRPPNVAGRGR
jgi:hypothetical protein